MMAAAPDFNVEAAAQVAHAITVHRTEVEDDFFSAVDDLNRGEDDRGAGHLGEAEFAAGLFYLYLCIDRDLLLRNLGGDQPLAMRTLRALLEAVVKVPPSGKQASFASRAYASYVLAEKGRMQPRSLAVAYLKPVAGEDYLAETREPRQRAADDGCRLRADERRLLRARCHRGRGHARWPPRLRRRSARGGVRCAGSSSFRLFGPLAAWGEIAVGEIRPSALQPTRSALLGLLAAALGLERGDEPKHAALARAVRFGVQVESAGVPISDYHTAQVLPARRRRILATRADQVRGDRHELRHDALAARVPLGRLLPCRRLAGRAGAGSRPRPSRSGPRPPNLHPLPWAEVVPSCAATRAAGDRGELLPEALRSLPEAPFPLPTGGPEAPGLGLFWEGGAETGGLAPQSELSRRDDPTSRTRRSFRVRQESFAPMPPAEDAQEDDDDVPEPHHPIA